jgi:hypothetical protein
MSDDLEFDIDLDSMISEEEETPSQQPQLSNRIDSNLLVESEMQAKKLNAVLEELAQVKQHLESGKKTSFVDNVLQKYGALDPEIKAMSVELLQGYDQVNQAGLKKFFEHIDAINKSVIETKTKIEDINNRISYVQSNYAFDTLIRDTLERGFKDKDIKARHVDSAKKLHFKKMDKDASYALRVSNIYDNRNYTPDKKDGMIAQLILESYHKAMIEKSKDGKLAKTDLTPKAVIKQDKESKEIKAEIKKIDSETKEEAASMSDEDKVKAREMAKQNFLKRLNI